MNLDNRVYLAILLLIYVVVVSYIGYRSRSSKSGEDYFLASRSLPSWLLAITFVASWWGGGSAIDLVDQANRDGLSTFWLYGVPVLISTALLYLFAAGIRRVGTISQPELMERRYDRRTAAMLSLFIVIFMTIAAAVQVLVVGRFFQTFFDVPYEVGAIVGTAVVVVYSLFGGFRGVVLTDLLQFVFFLFAALFLFVVAYRNAGGFGDIGIEAAQLGREGFTSIMYNISDNIAYVITFGTSWMVQANVWQRVSAARTPESAQRMMGISFFLFIPLYLIVTLTGMLSLSSYAEPPEGGVVASMLMGLESPFWGGVIFVGLCSAIMSTMDSLFNTGALSLSVDLYGKYVRRDATPEHIVTVGRWATLFVALVALYIGLRVRSVLTISWIGADFIATGAFVPLIGGFLWRRGTSKAAFVSMVFGVLFSTYNLLVALGCDLPVGWEIASTRQAMVGMSCSAVLYFVVSLMTRAEYEKGDKFIGETQIFGGR